MKSAIEYSIRSWLLTLFSSADPKRRAIHRRQNSARKALWPSLLPERSSAMDTQPGSARLRRRDFPTKRAAAARLDREMKEMLRLTLPSESSRSHKQSPVPEHSEPGGGR